MLLLAGTLTQRQVHDWSCSSPKKLHCALVEKQTCYTKTENHPKQIRWQLYVRKEMMVADKNVKTRLLKRQNKQTHRQRQRQVQFCHSQRCSSPLEFSTLMHIRRAIQVL